MVYRSLRLQVDDGDLFFIARLERLISSRKLSVLVKQT